MPLPELDSPIYTLKLPSNGKEIKYRPFLVKEEKMVMIAMQQAKGNENDSDDSKVVIDTIKNVIKNCILDKSVNVEKLPYFDVEYIFLQLRIKSKGDMTTLAFKCKNTLPDGTECGEINNVAFDLKELNVVRDPAHQTKICIDENKRIFFEMRYPNMDDLINLEKSRNDLDKIFEIIPSFIESVYKDDGTIYEFTRDELAEWLEKLTEKQFDSIKTFLETMPKIKHTLKLVCKKCGHTEEIELSGLSSFLA